MKLSFLVCSLVLASFAAQAAETDIAAESINALGVDLYRAHSNGEDNVLISPYSIQCALAMTYAGAEGDTRAEMQRVLHFPADDSALHPSFKSFAEELGALVVRSAERVRKANEWRGPATAIELNVASRLFAQSGYSIRPAFLSLVKDNYSAPLEEMDFAKAPEASRVAINRWVGSATKDRIRDLIPAGGIAPDTGLALVNALYLCAPWSRPFKKSATKNERFLVRGRDGVEVPTMVDTSSLGYAKHEGYTVVSRHYDGRELQFVIILPDKPTGLTKIEGTLDAKILRSWSALPPKRLTLHLPKFRIEPPTVPLGDSLKKLGMKAAFDDPKGTANFDRMAPSQSSGRPYIGAVLHKTFLALDEKGTEAAAATVVEVLMSDSPPSPDPTEIRVDRPFLFAIQHVPTGACLFLGRVTDPR